MPDQPLMFDWALVGYVGYLRKHLLGSKKELKNPLASGLGFSLPVMVKKSTYLFHKYDQKYRNLKKQE